MKNNDVDILREILKKYTYGFSDLTKQAIKKGIEAIEAMAKSEEVLPEAGREVLSFDSHGYEVKCDGLCNEQNHAQCENSCYTEGRNSYRQKAIPIVSKLQKEVETWKDKYNKVNPDCKEPINYNSTLTYFASQINIPLWKAMQCGKYFQIKYANRLTELEKRAEHNKIEKICKGFGVSEVLGQRYKLAQAISRSILEGKK